MSRCGMDNLIPITQYAAGWAAIRQLSGRNACGENSQALSK